MHEFDRHLEGQLSTLVTGVSDQGRLAAVRRAELHGHLGDGNLDAIVGTLRVACGGSMAVVNIVTPDLQTYPAESGVGAPSSSVPDQLSFCAEIVETGRPLVVANASDHPVYGNNPLVKEGAVGAYAGVPLVEDGYVLGSVSVFADAPHEFTPEELEVLHHQARLVTAIFALRRSARTDPLTGLPNRAMFYERLSTAIRHLDRRSGKVGVLFIDVDGFKAVNDQVGHRVGDRVLVELGSTMSNVLRPTDLLARHGGDEFVIVCEDLSPDDDGSRLAERLIATASKVKVEGVRRVGISVGVATTSSPSLSAEEMISAAYAAMYEAKASCGSSWRCAGEL